MSLAEELKVMQAEYTELHRDMQKKKSALDKLQAKIKLHKAKMGMDMPSVTDHAILRMAERKYGVNIEQIKKEILCEPVISAIRAGAKKIKYDGMEFVLNDGLVITVY